MPTVSKRLLFAAVAAVMLVPNMALAQEGEEPTSTPKPTVTATPEPEQVETTALCTKIGVIAGRLGEDTNTHFQKLSDGFSNRGDKISHHFNEVNQKLADKRYGADAAREQRFASLVQKAQNDGQKQAILTFQSEVKAAVTTHRSAISDANAAFKQGVIDAVTQRQSQLKAAAAAYRTAVTAALAQAKASCVAGTAPSTVRNRLAAALNTAKANLDTARKNAEKVKPGLDSLKATRKAAIEQANASFKAAIQSALTKLKAVLAASQPSATPKPSESPEN